MELRSIVISPRKTPANFSFLSAILILLFFSVTTKAVEPLRIAIISDMNGSYGSTHYQSAVDAAISRILELQPALVLSTGDMVAGQRRPHLSEQEITPMWQAFHQHVSDPLARAGIPFAVTPGNHDASAYAGFGLERAIYSRQWAPRKPGVHFLDDAGYPYNYSFAVGDVMFISLDATMTGHLPQPQMDWLRAVLKTHGSSYRYRVVFSHLPLWPFAQGRERETIGDHQLQVLLEQSSVDLFLNGHHHAFYPGVLNGVAFVSQSCLGAGLRRLVGSGEKAKHSFTLIEFSDGAMRIAALTGSKFEQEIDWDTLPTHIHSPTATLQRADLSTVDVKRLRAN